MYKATDITKVEKIYLKLYDLASEMLYDEEADPDDWATVDEARALIGDLYNKLKDIPF